MQDKIDKNVMFAVQMGMSEAEAGKIASYIAELASSFESLYYVIKYEQASQKSSDDVKTHRFEN